MSKEIFLFKQHKDFQSGSSHLNTRAAYDSKLLQILGLFIVVGVFTAAILIMLVAISRDYPNVANMTWFLLISLIAASLIPIAFLIFMLLRERDEINKYQILQAEGVILDATVKKVTDRRKVIEVRKRRGRTYVTEFETIHVKQADYEFISPNGNRCKDEINNDTHIWPRDIHEGDILHILYADDDNYCVL